MAGTWPTCGWGRVWMESVGRLQTSQGGVGERRQTAGLLMFKPFTLYAATHTCQDHTIKKLPSQTSLLRERPSFFTRTIPTQRSTPPPPLTCRDRSTSANASTNMSASNSGDAGSAPPTLPPTLFPTSCTPCMAALGAMPPRQRPVRCAGDSGDVEREDEAEDGCERSTGGSGMSSVAVYAPIDANGASVSPSSGDHLRPPPTPTPAPVPAPTPPPRPLPLPCPCPRPWPWCGASAGAP